MNYYSMHYRNKFQNSPLIKKSELNSIQIEPSHTIYYDKYPYKLSLVDNGIHYNIKETYAFLSWLHTQTWEYRDSFTPTSRLVYLQDYDIVKNACKKFPQLISSVFGPISTEHLEQLLTFNITIEYRKKYWYNKYNTKIILHLRQRDKSAEEVRKEKVAITDFINTNCKDFKWYTEDATGSWWKNYIYLTEQESNDILPFLKMSYNEFIDSVVKCEIFK